MRDLASCRARIAICCEEKNVLGVMEDVNSGCVYCDPTITGVRLHIPAVHYLMEVP